MSEASPVRWITQLPYTVCLDILFLLHSKDLRRLQRVSRETHTLATSDDLLIRFLKRNYPQAREARIARSISPAASELIDWLFVIDLVTDRHQALMEENVDPGFGAKDPAFPLLGHSNQRQPFWNFAHSGFRMDHWRPEGHEDRHSDEVLWTYSAEDSLLVYPAGEDDDLDLVAEDLETNEVEFVPFELAGKILRRLRLRHRILIIEWCHSVGSWVEGTAKLASTHFVTVFDVTTSCDDGRLPLKGRRPHSPWSFTFRAEWKLSETSLRIGDKVFSTHNASHYASYICKSDPCFRTGHQTCFLTSKGGPECAHEEISVWRFVREEASTNTNLRPCGVLLDQKWSPTEPLRFWFKSQAYGSLAIGIGLDECTWDGDANSVCGHLYVQHEEIWDGPEGLLHTVMSTGVPLISTGPEWREYCHAPHDSVCYGLDWSRSAFQLHRAPCWRHHRPGGNAIYDTIFDSDEEITFAAALDWDYERRASDMELELPYGILCMPSTSSSGGFASRFVPSMWLDIQRKGRIEGDSRRLVGESLQCQGPRVIELV